MNDSKVLRYAVSLFLISASFLKPEEGRAGDPVIRQEGEAKENIDYRWAFVARAGEAGKRRAASIARDTVMKSGEEFKLMVHLLKKSFVYVLSRNSKGDVALLFPYTLGQFDSDYQLEKNYYVPKGREWFKLDKNTGPETFYILASNERLTELESALRQYMRAADMKKGEAADSLMVQIKEIKKRFRSFSTIAERPISIAGNVRGAARTSVDVDRLDIATMATEISASNFYSKTVTIDHR